MRFALPIVIAAFLYLIVCGVQVEMAARSASGAGPRRVSAIVVNGGCGAARVDSDLRARLDWAASLYRSRRAPTVFVCTGPALASEDRLLSQHGVPSSRIVALQAANTPQQLSGLAARLGKDHRALVVTDAIDSLWTEGVASGDGLKVAVSPPPQSKRLFFSEMSALWREATGIAVGRVIGFGHASWAGS